MVMAKTIVDIINDLKEKIVEEIEAIQTKLDNPIEDTEVIDDPVYDGKDLEDEEKVSSTVVEDEVDGDPDEEPEPDEEEMEDPDYDQDELEKEVPVADDDGVPVGEAEKDGSADEKADLDPEDAEDPEYDDKDLEKEEPLKGSTVIEGEGDGAEYKKFFADKLKKYGVKSPSSLDDAKKKEFFAEIKKDWTK